MGASLNKHDAANTIYPLENNFYPPLFVGARQKCFLNIKKNGRDKGASFLQ